jgi:hypothetical protein
MGRAPYLLRPEAASASRNAAILAVEKKRLLDAGVAKNAGVTLTPKKATSSSMASR